MEKWDVGKLEATLGGSAVATVAIAGAVVAVIIAVLIADRTLIFVKERKSNRNGHVVVPADTGIMPPVDCLIFRFHK